MKRPDNEPIIEVRQFDASDIINKRPSGICTWAMSLIAIFILVVGILSMFISYSVVIKGDAYASRKGDSLQLVTTFEPLVVRLFEPNKIYQAIIFNDNKAINCEVVTEGSMNENNKERFALKTFSQLNLNSSLFNARLDKSQAEVIVVLKKEKLLNWIFLK